MDVALHLDGRIALGSCAIALGRTRELLDALAEQGSLQAAARQLDISYRSAWGRLAALEESLGRPVALKTKGHGSALTAFGAEFLGILSGADGRCAPLLQREAASLREALDALLAPRSVPLRLAASQDPLLAELLAGMPEIELSIAGSLEALARLAAGSADAAAFHYGSEGPPPPPFDAVFRDPRLTIVPLFRREQGFMVSPGNPYRIEGPADIARCGARFANRQRGAGTRIWFERLCREAGVRPEDIAGYGSQEFTHQAVAALVASGAADVGMGTRAVAAAFGLDFRSVGSETFYLAVRASIDPAPSAKLLDAARRAAPERLGYGPPGSGAYQSSACG